MTSLIALGQIVFKNLVLDRLFEIGLLDCLISLKTNNSMNLP